MTRIKYHDKYGPYKLTTQHPWRSEGKWPGRIEALCLQTSPASTLSLHQTRVAAGRRLPEEVMVP
jgi:hypothetical protein